MMRPMISAIAFDRANGRGHAAVQELHAMAGVHKLPVQEIEDQSLVYPTAEKR